MRLIRCDDLKLVEFYRPPRYAILSHTWEEDEVTYQEMLELTSRTKEKRGFDKILHAAILAEDHDLEYVWVDTCCIDKSSSSELSEAINSMYKWYQQAEICFVVLSDVSARHCAIYTGWGNYEQERHALASSIFERCRWATRGWTLQELIAPRFVLFYDADYNCFGSKQGLRDILSQATDINRDVLESSDPSSASIAQRMSWAANRETSREEDLAYCLMGLFGVHMPLLYGEGNRAFIRLQEEILKSSDDHSLFAWTSPVRRERDGDNTYRGLLAHHPAEFERRAWRTPKREPAPVPGQLYEDQSTLITNKGIRFSAPLIPLAQTMNKARLDGAYQFLDLQSTAEDLFIAVLNCDDGLGIVMLQMENQDQFVRVYSHRIFRISPKEEPNLRRMYVRQDVRIPKHHQSSRLSSLVVRYHDYVNRNQGRNRSFMVLQPADTKPFQTDGTENLYKLAHGLFDRSQEPFMFWLTVGSVSDGLMEANQERGTKWRVRNNFKQRRSGAEYESDDEVSAWYNKWRGNVEVRLVFDHSLGAYEVFYGYDTTGKGSQQEYFLITDKQHSNFGGLVPVATSGSARVEFEIRAQTKLINGRPDVVLDIREYITKVPRPV